MTNVIDSGSSNVIIADQTGVSPGKVVKDVTPTITSPNILGTVLGPATYNNITLNGASAGIGIFPLGSIIPVASNLSGSFSIPTSGTVSSGWQLCNGVAIPGGNTLSGNTPNLADNRFLMGSSSAGTASGTNLITPVGSIGGSQSIQHHHTFAHTHTTNSQLGTISLNHGHNATHTHSYGLGLLDNHNNGPGGPNAALGIPHGNATQNQAGVYDYNTNTFAAGFLDYGGTSFPINVAATYGKPNQLLQNGTQLIFVSSGNVEFINPTIHSALSDYNASHSHGTAVAPGSQSTTDTSDNTGSNTINGSNFSFTGTQFDSRPQYFSVQYIIRVS